MQQFSTKTKRVVNNLATAAGMYNQSLATFGGTKEPLVMNRLTVSILSVETYQ